MRADTIRGYVTAEHPEEPRGLVRCRKCGTAVYAVNDDGAIVLRCYCEDTTRTIQQIATLPSGWVA